MLREFEAIIWCQRCEKDIYTLYRKPAGPNGTYVHEAEPPEARDKVMANKGKCECGEILMRKP